MICCFEWDPGFKKNWSNQVESSQITGQFFRLNQCLMKAAITVEGHGLLSSVHAVTLCEHYQLKTIVNVQCIKLGGKCRFGNKLDYNGDICGLIQNTTKCMPSASKINLFVGI